MKILLVKGLKNYAKIFTGNNYCLSLKTLKSIETLLGPYQFMRIPKFYIVLGAKISQYNGKCVLINNKEIPVAVSYREALKAYLNSNKL
ncbi:LytTR family transcriptional regulator DNA-binding domain-containing protein [Mesonia sp. K4-1]|uniref:LytTR family transcriptional regulator DNA-binding domain-containing protein n=1 Tax=Mesonia sp. K4-1 TaxID=2602760 RepID=UPI00351A8C20